ncbi:YDG domain-containing protein, partial [Limnohabitans sp. DM1]|uniref:YDG domain-containing protein n=1 Tax=Limnohabitans sp. DM1 TaxID=1597955 RepID=UPI000A874153
MNSNLFKTVFSKRLGALVAVGEHATSQGKAKGGRGVGGFNLMGVLSAGGAYFVGPLVFSFALITLAWAAPANNALPTGGQVAQGAAAISQSGANMAIHQSTARAVVNWQSFDIGKDAKVNIVQPTAQAVLLNRVTGVAPSQIFGQMSANGQVVLVNPNGVTFGKDGSVSAAGLTASTLNISDADFMAGRKRFTRDGATGEVLNQGTLTAAPGGYVALLGASVSNEGKIYAPKGNVALGAADVITLPMTGTGRIKMELSPAVINAAVANQKGGTIVTEGGQVYMQAAAMGNAMASVLQSGSIDTSGEQGGAVHLLADGGTIKVDGSINANSTGKDDKGQLRKGGDILIGRDEETGKLSKSTDASGATLSSEGGFVETSGDYLKVDDIQVKAKDWLLDPTNITIAATGTTTSGTAYAANYTAGADSVILASAINSSLNLGTSVTIATSATGASAGNISVNESIAKTAGADATLTLKAHGNIVVATSKTITSTTGKLNVVLNSDFDANSSGAILFNNGSGITSNGGNITLGGGTAGTGVGHAFGSSTAAAPTSTAAVTTTSDGITLNGTAISAGGGNITMTGTSNASNGSGINAINNSSIITSGAGAITLTGTGKASGGTASLNGVGLLSTPVTGGSGGVTIVGNASAATTSGAYTYGVMVKNSTVSTVNGGNISVTGTGGGGTANTNYGFSIDGSGKVAASGAGNVSITGVAANTSSSAININAGSGGIQSITGNITLTADSVALNGTVNGGTVTLQNRTAGTTIDVGGTSADVTTGTPLKLSITQAELTQISAGTIVVGRNDTTTTGAIAVNAINMGALGNTSGNLTILGSNNITVNSAITKTAGSTATLTMNARNGITVNAAVGSSTNAMNVVATTQGLSATDSQGIYLSGTGKIDTIGTVKLDATARKTGTWDYTRSGLAMTAGAVVRGSDVDIKLLVDLPSTNRVYGLFVQNSTTLEATAGNLKIDATIKGVGQTGGTGGFGGGLLFGSGTGNAVTIKASQDVLISSDMTSTTATGTPGISMVDTAVQAGRNAVISSKVWDPSMSAFSSGNGGSARGFSLVSTNNAGNVSLQSNQGTINIGNLVAPITGNNVTIDNTGGVISAPDANGLVSLTKGTGSSTSTILGGVTLNSNTGVSGVSATGNANIAGTSTATVAQSGIAVNGNAAITAKNIAMDGSSMLANGVLMGAALSATANGGGNVTVVGTSNGTPNTATALSMQGAITATHNVSILGTNTNAANTAVAVNLSKSVTSTAGTIDITASTQGSSAQALQMASGVSLQTTNQAITLKTDTLSLDTSATPASINAGTGTVSIKNDTAGTLIDLGTGTDAGAAMATPSARTLGLSSAELNRITAGNLVIGDAANSGNVRVSSAINLTRAAGNLTLQTPGNIAVNAALVVGDDTTTTGTVENSKNLTLNAAGAASTVTQTAAIKATDLLLQGSNAAVTLANTSNDVATLAGSAKTLSYFDSNVLTIGTTTALSATGPIKIESDSNIIVSQAISTTDASSDAIWINAGKATNAGTASGGNISFTGSGAVNVGTGGRATLFTGSVAGSTGLGITAGNSRFASDEVTTAYNTTTAALGSGIYAIYRESPILTAAFINASKTYDGQAYSGNNGLTLSGFVNGDTTGLLNTTTTGSSQGAKNAGSYTLSGTGTSDLGYTVAYTPGTLTVNKADLVLSGTRVYDASKTFAGQFLTATGVAGETFAVTGTGDASNLSSKNVQTGQLLSSVTGLALGSSANGGLSANYNALSTAASSVSVTPKTATVSATATQLTYNGSTQNQLTETLSGFIAGDTVTVTGQASGKNAGSYASSLAVSGADASNYSVTLNNAHLVIDKAVLTATGNSGSVTYNGNTQSVNGFTVTGLQGSDSAANLSSINASGASGKNAGSYTNTVTAGTETNYTVTTVNGTLQIGRADLVLSGTRVYDGSQTFAGQYLTATGVAGETFAVNGSGDASNLASKNVQTGQLLNSVTGLALGSSANGGLSANYNALSTAASSVSVTPKAASVSATATNLTYNGSTQNQLTETTSGIIAGDTVSFSGQASGKNAGTYASSLVAGGADAGNYTITVSNANLVIDKANLVLSGTRVYDASKTFAGQYLTASGVAGETFAVTGTGDASNLASKNVQSGQTLSSLTGLALGSSANGGLSANYNALSTAASSVSVTPKTATVSATATQLSYNGSTQNQLTETLSGFIAGDTVTVTGQASGKNAGSYASSLAVSGADASNYSVTLNNAHLVIDKAVLTATGNSGSVTYNGNTQSVNGFTVTGLQGSDSAASLTSINATGASGKNAGSYANTVTAGTETNYTVTTVNGTMQIGRADLVLSGTRVYDGSQTFAGQYLTATGMAGETFAVNGSGDASNLASKNVQTGQVLSSITGLSLGSSSNGGLSSNYNALSTVASSVSVTPKAATVSATTTNLTYNASTQNQLAETNSGFITGDVITVTGQASGKDAGTYASSLTLSGADLGNYSVTVNNANLVIGKAALTATGNSATVTYNGADQSVSGLTVSGLLGSDTLASLSTVSAAGATGKNAGTYSNVVSAGTETNYTVTTVNGTLQIDKAALTATGNSGSVTYNGTEQSVTGFTVSGLQGSDTAASLSSVSATGASGKNAGSYTNTVTAGTEANYTVTTANGTLQIGKASLTATGNSAALTYNGADQSVSGFTVSGLLGSDTVANLSSITASGATGKNAGNYTNTVTAGTEANYTVTTANGTLQIGKAALTATGNSAALTYNGADHSVSGFTVSGLQGSDTVASLSSVMALGATGKNAGSYTNTVTAGTETNYTVTTANGTLQIGRADLVLSGERVYDAGTTFAGQYLTATGVGGETFAVSGSGSAGNLASKNVQVQQALTSLAGLALGSSANGGLSSNYNDLTTAGSKVSVTPKAATVNATASSATYNGTQQNQAAETSSGFIAGDTITVSGLASGKYAGTYVSNLAVGGADAGNYSVSLNNANLVIDKAALTVTATAVSKTYDGTTLATGTGTVGTLAGAGDSVSSAGSQAFLDKNAGTGKTVRASGVTIKDAANADMSANYSITYVDDVSSVINKASLTVTANADARFVGRSDVAGYTGVSYTGLVTGETPSVLGGNLNITRTNASAGAAGNYSGVLAPSGLTSGNYDITYVNGDYTIVPADRLLVRTSNVTTTYGSAVTYDATAQYLDSNNDVIITLTRTGTGNNYNFDDGLGTTFNTVLKPYSGTGLAPISSSGNTVVGTYDIKDAAPTVNGSNFIAPAVFVGTLTVNTKEITPNATNVSKVYDGTTAISNVLGMGGKVAGDALSIGGTTAFASKNAGTGLAYTVSGIALSGADAANYHIAGGATTLAGSDGVITPAALKLTSSDVTKVYDRTTSANGTALVTQGTQLYASDSITGGTFSFNDKNVGAGNKVVSVSAVTINDGNNGGNYSVTYVDNTTSTITPKSLTASFSAVSKTYDGSTVASVTGSSGDVISGDAVTLSNTAASFDNKNAGTSKTVTVTGIALSGADAGNYSLQNSSATTTANVTAKNLTASYSAASKTYDGGVAASVTGGSADIVSGDVVDFSQTSAVFADKNAGAAKSVAIAGIAIAGTDAGNYALQNTTANATADITRKDVSLSSLSAANKVYDGTTVASITAGSIDTGVGSETLQVSGVGSFSDKNVANGKAVTVADVSTLSQNNGTGDWSNYRLSTTGALSTTADITPKAITLTGITADSKTYDGGTTATLLTSSAAFNGQIAGDVLTVSSTGSFSDKNVATGKTVSLTNTLGGADLGNYTITQQTSTTADITKKTISLSGITAANKTYDGNTSATVSTTNAVFNDKVSGDELTVSSSGVFSDKNAATGKTVSLTHTLGGADLGNYSIAQQTSTTADIDKKAISLSGITASNRTYDGTTAATVSVGSAVFNEQVAGDVLTVASTGTFSDKNADTGKTVTLVNTLGGTDLGNYTVTEQASTTANIDKKAISLSGITAASKTYDGGTSANVSTTGAVFNDKVSGDDLSVSSTGTFSDKNADTGKTVTLSNTLSGADVGNYTVTEQTSTTANIDKKAISLSGITAANKTYDGGTTATVSTTNAVFNNKVTNDDLTVTSTGTFSDKNADTGKTVTLSNTLSGADVGNYTVTEQTSTTANIDKKVISLSGITAANKTYDGGTTATVSTTNAVFNNKVTNDDLTVTSTGTFSDKNADTGKTVTLSNTLGGADLVNYTVTEQANTTADIHKKAVTLDSITAASKTYDGSTTATVVSGTISGTITGETLAISGSGSFLDKNVANGKTVTIADVTTLTPANGSGDWANYSLSTTGSLSTTAHITPKSVTLDAIVAAHKTYDGNTVAAITSGVISGTAAGETLSVTGVGVFADKNAASGIAVNVADVTALTPANGSGNWANYTLTTTGAASTTANITKASLQAALTGTVEKTYDGTTVANNLSNSHFALTGWVGSEGASISQVNGSYASKNVSDNNGTGSVTATLAAGDFTAASGTLLANYQLPTSATGLVGKITPASLTVKVNDTAAFVTQDASLATDNGLSYTGFVNGETAATALTGTPTRTYSGVTYPVVGTYTDVYGLSAAPTANNGNYTVTVAKGKLTVAPADKLLIGIGGKTYTYGSLTGTTAGASA